MLDHALLDLIAVLRESLADALLERQRADERLHIDVLSGDVTWEASYALPGEGDPPRVRADVTVDWPTWSQTAYRDWMLEGALADPLEVGIEIVLRIQDLVSQPDLERLVAALPDRPPELGEETLERGAPMVERAFDAEMVPLGWAAELVYEGTYEMGADVLGDGALLAGQVGGLGRWLASALVSLGDVRLSFRPQS